MKTSYKHIPLLIIVLSITIAVGLLYLYMYRTVGLSADKSVAAWGVVNSQKQSDLQAKRTAEMYANTINDRAILSTFFVTESSIVTFIEALENIGPQAGGEVTISAVSAEDVSKLKIGNFAKVKAHFESIGPWASTMRALMLSEILPYRSTISNVKLDSSTDTDGKTPKRVWKLSYDIEVDLIKTNVK